MVECERDGDGLHWLWDSRRGEPGTVRGNGTLNELYIIFDYWTFMSERDLLLVFLLVNCL